MFLKKKKTEIEAVNPGESDDKRNAYRYPFSGKDALSVIYLGKPGTLINISAGGLAFTNQGFSKGDADQIQLNLSFPHPSDTATLQAKTRIFHISPDGICHCAFENLTPNQKELIHKYVLEMQKKDLRR